MDVLRERLRFSIPTIPARERPLYVLVAAWLLAMIAVPIAGWTFGADALPAAISVGVIMQVIAVCALLISVWGARQTGIAVGVIVVLAWGVEFIGHTTGFPFGSYDYTPRLQPQIGGVPLLVPLAWLMMLPPAWIIAHRIIGGGAAGGGSWTLSGRLRFAAVTALAFTAWDLFLDPQMVGWDLWRWNIPGEYFGIPLVNFGGWLLASSTITLAASFVAPLRRLPARPLVLIYVVTWLLQTGGLALFWGLPGPALFGFVGMGGMLWWAWRRAR